MGLLVDGVWVDRWYDTKKSNGRFIRNDAQFRREVSADGSSSFPAEAGRYHLYVSLACPWAHRTLIFRRLKGLESIISVSVVHWFMDTNGWTFEDGPGVIGDLEGDTQYMHQVYTKAKADYSGRVTVPVLWDRKTNTIVNNESSEIIRMFNSAFNAFAERPELDLYPADKREEIDGLNEWIYATVNNGVYRCGFATTQEAYDEAVVALFASLDRLEGLLAQRRYLTGDRPTEADWRLFTTLIRFDPVYVGHFKCNIRRLFDYPNLWNYTLDLYQQPGVAQTVNLQHIQKHYYQSHTSINPHRVVPRGPQIDYSAPHDRTRFDQAG